MQAATGDIEEIINFWFNELAPDQWYVRDEDVDRHITQRFAAVYERLAKRVPSGWLNTANGCLAAVIVLDQFPRNLFRDEARAFATDQKAWSISNDAIERGLDEDLPAAQRTFLYMPWQHSEDAAVQRQSVELFNRLGDAGSLDFACRHQVVIDRFGRFPHRNKVLGRFSTAEEEEFLAQKPTGF